jgi:hypothetical protein
MSLELSGEVIGSKVLQSIGGLDVKRHFKLDTANFSWVDDFLRDEALRKKIMDLRENIDKTRKSKINKDELRKMFDSAVFQIEQARLSWFEENLKSVQDRTGAIFNSFMLSGNRYISPLGLSKENVDALFEKLPEGISQAQIDEEIKVMHSEIAQIEAVIAEELSPRSRWIYREDGEPQPYPRGCRWTQFVIAWKKIIPRFDGLVSIEGLPIDKDGEKTAYYALGLDKIAKLHPLRKPGETLKW